MKAFLQAFFNNVDSIHIFKYKECKNIFIPFPICVRLQQRNITKCSKCFKNSFKILKTRVNLFRGYVWCFEVP
jgi:hypothetical protein